MSDFNEIVVGAIKECINAGADEKVSQEFFSGVAATIESGMAKLSGEDKPDSKTRILLQDIIDTAKGAPGINYDKPSEMISRLLLVKTLYTLNSEIQKCQDKFVVYSYEYAMDQERFKGFDKICEGLMYALEDPKDSTRSNAILFCRDSVIFVKMKKGMFQVDEKLKVKYEDIIAASCGADSKAGEEYIDIICGDNNDALTWECKSFEIESMDAETICDVLESIVMSRLISDDENVYNTYYERMCQKVYSVNMEDIKIKLYDYWQVITVLGEKAFAKNESSCRDILLATYQKCKNRARLDNDINMESFCRKRILTLADSIDNLNRRRVRIDSKRQVIIPERMMKLMNFGDDAEFVYSEGKLELRAVNLEKAESDAELLLEELVAIGLTGQELIDAFKSGKLPENPDDFDDADEAVAPVTPKKTTPAKKPRVIKRKKDEDDDDIIY